MAEKAAGGGTGSGDGGGAGSGADAGGSGQRSPPASGEGGQASGQAGAGGAGAGDGKSGAGAGAGAGAQQGAGAVAAAAAGAGAGGAGAGEGAGDGKGKAGEQPANAWGENWRKNYAGDDAKKLNVLERYDSPKAALDALFAARQRIDSGDLKAKLPENATAEQVAAWRKDNGIPEKPEGYLEGLPADLAKDLSDEDKAIITPYLSAMQELNLTPAQAHKLIALRQAEQERQVEARIAADETLRTKTEDTLRSEWGNDYRANINIIHSWLNGAPPEVAEAFLNARTADGEPLVGTPEVLRFLAQNARALRDVGAIVETGAGGDPGKGIDDRLKELNTWMGAPKGSADYNKYWSDPKVQAEYRDLLDRQTAINRRRQAA